MAFIKDSAGLVMGAAVEADGRRIDVAAKVVVNAAGVWADELRTLEDGQEANSIRPAKGIHITVPWEKVRNDIAVVIPVRGDKRSLFVVPWGERSDGTFEHTYVGTTDTDYAGPLEDPPCTADDIAYVLAALNQAVTTGITTEDVTGVWAGLRPLVKSATSGRTADLSRRHRVTTGSAGVIAITGGKLTTYREMAQDTVDAVLRRLQRRARGRTARLKLLGAEGFKAPTGDRSEAHLANRYGSLARNVTALIDADPSLGGPLVPGLDYVRAEAVYAARHEMVCTLEDVLVRRTRAHLFNRAATLEAAPAVAELLAAELGWDAAETSRQVAAYRELVETEEKAAATSATSNVSA